MQIGGEIHGGGENSFVLLAFAFAVKLFPPFGKKVQFGIIVSKNLNFFALFVKFVADGSVNGGQVHFERSIGSGGFFHVFGSLKEFADIYSGNRNG